MNILGDAALSATTPGDYVIIAILILTAIAICTGIMVVTHIIGPKRQGDVKNMPYESGVDPVHDARHRFNVRFYLIAVLFLVFDVEIIFLYPWAVLYPKLSDPSAAAVHAGTVGDLANLGYNGSFFLVSIGLFFTLLTVGFIYEWRKGIFRWD